MKYAALSIKRLRKKKLNCTVYDDDVVDNDNEHKKAFAPVHLSTISTFMNKIRK